jgi:hypothetical protein
MDVTATVLERLRDPALSGVVKLELRGEAVVYVRLGAEPTVTSALGAGERPDVIVRSDRRTLAALLEGRMRLSDGLVSERLSLAGDVTRIVAIKKRLIAT